MNLKIAYLSVIMLGCTAGSQSKIKSEWSGLIQSGASDCRVWPLQENDLEIQAIHPLIGKSGLMGFEVDAKTIDGGVSHSFQSAPSGIDFDVKEAQSIPLGVRSVVLAGIVVDSIPIIIIGTTTGGRTILEARSLIDNSVIAKSNYVLDGSVTKMEVAINGGVAWLTLRIGDYSTLYSRLAVKQGIGAFEKANFTTETRGASIVVAGKKNLPYLIENQSSSEKAVLKISPVKPKELSLGDPQNIELMVPGGLESWAIEGAESGLSFAAVLGDSMVGQASLLISHLEFKQPVFSWGWQERIKLSDIHVSEPVWAKSGRTLTLMKWLNAEATLGVYRLSPKGISSKVDRGVYPAGSIALSAFELSDASIGLIVRQKKEKLWTFSICRVKL